MTARCIGFVPAPGTIDTRGLDITPETMRALMEVDPAAWEDEVQDQEAFFGQFGDRLPEGIRQEDLAFRSRLKSAGTKK